MHHDQEEWFYVIAGEYLIEVGDAVLAPPEELSQLFSAHSMTVTELPLELEHAQPDKSLTLAPVVLG